MLCGMYEKSFTASVDMASCIRGYYDIAGSLAILKEVLEDLNTVYPLFRQQSRFKASDNRALTTHVLVNRSHDHRKNS